MAVLSCFCKEENKGYKTLLNEAEKREVIFETEAIPVKKGFAKLNTGAAEFSLCRRSYIGAKNLCPLP